MANHLVACVLVRHFLAQAAAQQLSGRRSFPLVVATGSSDRATVIDVCPHADTHAVHAGMPVWEARRLCPALRVTAHDPVAVEEAATSIEQVLRQYADELHCRAPGCWTLPLYALGTQFSRAEVEAERLRQDVGARTGYPCTVGLGAHSIVAYLAALVAAERGGKACVVAPPGGVQEFLAPLPVRLLPGLGPRSEATLQRLGVTSIGQLAQIPVDVLVQVCGPRGRTLAHLAQGLEAEDDSRSSPTVSSTWHATQEPCADAWRLLATIQRLSECVGQSLRVQQQAAGRLTVQVTWTDRAMRQRTVPFTARRDLDHELARASREALRELLRDRRLAVLQMVVIAGDLGPIQQGLFAVDDSRRRQLQQAVDAVRRRFGSGAIQAGTIVGLA